MLIHSASAFFNNVTYVPPKVPTLYSVLSAGDQATNPLIYGSNTNSFILPTNSTIELIINNNDDGVSIPPSSPTNHTSAYKPETPLPPPRPRLPSPHPPRRRRRPVLSLQRNKCATRPHAARHHPHPPQQPRRPALPRHKPRHMAIPLPHRMARTLGTNRDSDILSRGTTTHSLNTNRAFRCMCQDEAGDAGKRECGGECA